MAVRRDSLMAARQGSLTAVRQGSLTAVRQGSLTAVRQGSLTTFRQGSSTAVRQGARVPSTDMFDPMVTVGVAGRRGTYRNSSVLDCLLVAPHVKHEWLYTASPAEAPWWITLKASVFFRSTVDCSLTDRLARCWWLRWGSHLG